MPTLADIIARIDDQRPGAEEAWAMLPKAESDSVVWTDEMAESFGVIRDLLDDPIAARMAFREVYEKAVIRAREERRPVHWSVSLGADPAGRAAALEDAVRKGRLPEAHARALLPELAAAHPPLLSVGGPEEPGILVPLGPILDQIGRKPTPPTVVDPTPEELEERRRLFREQAKRIEGDEA